MFCFPTLLIIYPILISMTSNLLDSKTKNSKNEKVVLISRSSNNSSEIFRWFLNMFTYFDEYRDEKNEIPDELLLDDEIFEHMLRILRFMENKMPCLAKEMSDVFELFSKYGFKEKYKWLICPRNREVHRLD